jgi:heme/copper-type cytochrome/quinol oxidase subunit 2
VTLDTLLSTIILVSFLVTILMAIGSYVAYKLRESRRPREDDEVVAGESPFFEIIRPDDEIALGGDRRA